MSAEVDFVDHFWGDKHVGLSVLHANAKAGQQAVKELSDFFKERCALQDEHNKLLQRSANKVSAYANSTEHNIAPLWSLVKVALDRVNEIHAARSAALFENLKHAQGYADELQKATRELKNKQTIEAVNLMQTTTTCLQKAKETYYTRCAEVEKMRNLNDAAGLAKAESRKQRAAEEYKQYIDKHAKVTEDFQSKMKAAAATYQDHEFRFIERMQRLFIAFAQLHEDCAMKQLQAYSELRENCERVDFTQIMRHFVETKGTGTQAPLPVTFEELDHTKHNHTSTHSSNSSLRKQAPVVEEEKPPSLQPLPLKTDTTVVNDLISLSPDQAQPSQANNGPTSSNALENQLTLNADMSLIAQQQSSPSTSTGTQNTQPTSTDGQPDQTKLSLSSLLGLGRHKNEETSATAASGEGGFFSKRKKDRKRATDSNEATASTGNAITDLVGPPPVVDDEGYSIKPQDLQRSPRSRHSSTSSHSSSDDDEQTAKIRQLRIGDKTAEDDSSTKSIQDAVSKISLSNNTLWNSMSSGTQGRPPLRPTLTGASEPRIELRPSLTGGTARARPRATIHAPMSSARTMRAQSTTGSDDSSSLYRAESMSSISGDAWGATLKPALSMSSLAPGDQLPVAMAIHETIHAWFSIAEDKATKYAIALSFLEVISSIADAACVFSLLYSSHFLHAHFHLSTTQHLCHFRFACGIISFQNSPMFKLTNTERVVSLIPNKQVLDAKAVSAFSPARHEFTFDVSQLSSYLSKERSNKPAATFYNVEVLRYEVRAPEPLLEMQAFWKCDEKQTDIRVDYALASQHTLLNVLFTTKIESVVDKVHSRPEAHWSSTDSTLSWKLTELSPHGTPQGSLKARVTLANGPASTPQPVHARFQVQEATVSGCSLELPVDSAYRLSLLRRRIQAGKYYAEAQKR